jgi:hypothetical protein
MLTGLMPQEDDKERSFTFRVRPKDLKGLDDLRRKETDVPSRGEMLRRLIERELARQAKVKT